MNPPLARLLRWQSRLLAALVVLLVYAVLAWFARDLPVVNDGRQYMGGARALHQGLGYVAIWSPEHVTPTAHFPVGYPLLIALLMTVFGEQTLAAIALAALGAAAMAACATALAEHVGVPTKRACWLGVAVALQPSLLLYSACVMTEAITASLLVVGGTLVVMARSRVQLALAGLVLGVATLVRPPSALLLVAFACGLPTAYLHEKVLRRLWVILPGALLVSVWVVRNELVIGRWIVSANAGWNLLIGSYAEAHGRWTPVRVSAMCSTVFDEGAVDQCFFRQALARIRANPLGWLALVPAKLRALFAWDDAARNYLFEAAPQRFGGWVSRALIGLTTFCDRLAVLGASWRAVRAFNVTSTKLQTTLFAGLVLLAALPDGTLAWCTLFGLSVMLIRSGEVLSRGLASVLGSIVLTHAVFFGGARYMLPALPWVALFALAKPSGKLLSIDSSP